MTAQEIAAKMETTRVFKASGQYEMIVCPKCGALVKPPLKG